MRIDTAPEPRTSDPHAAAPAGPAAAPPVAAADRPGAAASAAVPPGARSPGAAPLKPESAVLSSPVLCADGLRRCPWSLSSPVVLADHDTAWGLRPADPSGWFRALSLEILQAGLAPGAAASRLPALEEALSGFDPAAVALLDDDGVDELLLDRRLIRNRAKLTAVVLAARSSRGWSPAEWEEVLAADTSAREAVEPEPAVARLRERGIIHAGPATVARVLARTGLAQSHQEGCFRA